MFKVKIFWFLEDYFLETTDTSDCHLNADHDLEYKIEVFISKEYFFIVLSFYCLLFFVAIAFIVMFSLFHCLMIKRMQISILFKLCLFSVMFFFNSLENFEKLLMHFTIHLLCFINNFFKCSLNENEFTLQESNMVLEFCLIKRFRWLCLSLG